MSSFDYGKRGSSRRPNPLVLSDLYKPIRDFVKGEGDDAFVRVRSWNMLKSEPGPPTGRVLARGDLVRVFNFERVAPDGTPYVSVMSMRRWVAGVVPKDSLSDTHPLVDLAEDLKSLVHTKSGADHDFDAAFNEVSCTRGAYKIQNWLRGHVTAEGIDEARPGPLKELRGARAMADALRRNALTGRRKVVEFYVKPDKSRVTDPSNPHSKSVLGLQDQRPHRGDAVARQHGFGRHPSS